jgi:hypothetical protein
LSAFAVQANAATDTTTAARVHFVVIVNMVVSLGNAGVFLHFEDRVDPLC